MPRKRADVTGQRFGQFLVLSMTRMGGASGHHTGCVVRCQCGTEKVVRYHELKCGQSRSCGCIRRLTAQTRCKPRGHDLTEKDAILVDARTGRNRCRKCHNLRTRLSHARTAAEAAADGKVRAPRAHREGREDPGKIDLAEQIMDLAVRIETAPPWERRDLERKRQALLALRPKAHASTRRSARAEAG